MNPRTQATLLRVSAVLWIIWGLVHVLAGVLTMHFVLSGDITSGISGIADAVSATSLEMAYPAAVGAILSQHGFNLLWFGLVTLGAAFYIWRASRRAILLAALVGGLADLGYFLFLDLGGYVKFVPGTVMTLVSASAILISFIVYFRGNPTQRLQTHAESEAI